MRHVLFVACALLSATYCALAQAVPEPAQTFEPRTRLEELQYREGAVIVTGSSFVGRYAPPTGGGPLIVTARELIDLSTGARTYGITVRVHDVEDVRGMALVDDDEIGPLIEALDDLSSLDKKITKLDRFEAAYRTRGGLEILVFTDRNADAMFVAISAGDAPRARMEIPYREFPRIRELVAKATEVLDKARQ
ncbi:MAG: hypothetical protein KBD01_19590 [Acidobacteria bacterium]|nr:hypothetical protein [Acidobacteriota bacterium]